MVRTQLNINIDPALLAEIKEKSRLEGKTITSFISELLSNALSTRNIIPLTVKVKNLEDKIKFVEDKINYLISSKQKVTPFNDYEAKNCSEFMRDFFYQQIQVDKIEDRKFAFEELIKHLECFHQWNKLYSLRFKEILFTEDYDPFSSLELNNLTIGKQCPCPIRTGLINWKFNNPIGKCCCEEEIFPSQQEICDKGKLLIENIF